MNWHVPKMAGKNHVYRKEEEEREKGKYPIEV
jgi:hypothetical protein